MIFLEPPDDFRCKVRVAGIYVHVGEQFLVLQRHPAKLEGNRWAPPGGKCDQGETLCAAAVRELEEETGIRMSETSLKPGQVFYVRLGYGDFEYATFFGELSERPPVRLSEREHVEFRWVTPVEALTLPLMEDEDAVIRLCYPVDVGGELSQ